ncbi:MAG: (Fe-S)-binding protein [Desulfobacterales bacterium PC51MH44]|nr:MAG: (Fe-S)-binding protein [Desulfobacterales bacterium PC51MH44]
MPSMKELTGLMRELEDQLVVCMRCGMCQAVCPLFVETGREADVARGKLALLDGLLLEMFKDPQGVYERLNKCLLCGSCAANCPSGVSVLEIFIKARAILTGFMGLSPAKKVLLRGMLSRPEIFDRLAEWGAKFQKIFTRPANELIGTSCARIVSPLLGNRHFMPLAEVPFHRMIPSLNSNRGRSGIKVAFYVGCLIDKIFPKIAKDVIDVLNYHEVGIFMPAGQGCCGIPAISSGDTVTFNRLVRHNLEIFDTEKFDYLVTSCATCTSTIKEIWPMMADKNSGYVKSRVAKIAQKTLDINQFLVSKVELEKGAVEDRIAAVDVTYHDPCHLKKSLGVFAEPRSLINANPGYRLKEMPESDWCCGLGGSFNLQYYNLSTNIGMLKRDNIKASACQTIATGCPACMLQIADMLSKSGDNIAVKHPIELYRELLPESCTDNLAKSRY